MSTGWIVFLVVCVVVFLVCIMWLIYPIVEFGDVVDASTNFLENSKDLL